MPFHELQWWFARASLEVVTSDDDDLRWCGICENVGNFNTLVQSAWDSVEASCVGSDLRPLESSITDIDQRICSEEWLRDAVLHLGCIMARASAVASAPKASR